MERERAKRVEVLLNELLDTLDNHVVFKGHIRRIHVKATAGFFRAQYESIEPSVSAMGKIKAG